MVSIFRLPLRDTPWGTGEPVRPCPVCGKGWSPWCGSRLPCHARCLLADEGAIQLYEEPLTITQQMAKYDLSPSVVRASIRRGARLKGSP